MSFKLVMLPTDFAVYLLLLTVVAAAVYIASRGHLAAPWRRVGHSAPGMAGLTLMLVFIAFGLLDSLHFRMRLDNPSAKSSYAVEVKSVLDLALSSLHASDHHEKTYSAPLAAYGQAKDTVRGADGVDRQEYPRLRWGGSHLADPQHERAGDIVRRALAGAAAGAAAGLALCALLVWGRWRAAWRGETELRWRAVMVTVLALTVLAGAAAALAARYHVLGTDKIGEDVLYESLKSIRTALVIGTLTTLVTLPFALALGIAAGYFGGRVDDVIQYVYTVLNSIPGVLLVAASVLVMQVWMDGRPQWFDTAAERADARLLALCVILGATGWPGLCRLLRAETLKLRELEYVQAAQAFGVDALRILVRHILPNTAYLILITTVVDFSGLVLAEAVLTYVGVGVDPTLNSYGGMINNARLELAREPVVWWSLAAAFVFMVTLVLAANLFSDAVRDAFDPRVRTRASIRKPRPSPGAAA